MSPHTSLAVSATGGASSRTWAHEIGHTLGLGHAYSTECESGFESKAYDDGWNVMGISVGGFEPTALSGGFLRWAGTMQGGGEILVPNDGAEHEVTIDAVSRKGSGLRFVTLVDQAGGETYVLEYRDGSGMDADAAYTTWPASTPARCPSRSRTSVTARRPSRFGPPGRLEARRAPRSPPSPSRLPPAATARTRPSTPERSTASNSRSPASPFPLTITDPATLSCPEAPGPDSDHHHDHDHSHPVTPQSDPDVASDPTAASPTTDAGTAAVPGTTTEAAETNSLAQTGGDSATGIVVSLLAAGTILAGAVVLLRTRTRARSSE